MQTESSPIVCPALGALKNQGKLGDAPHEPVPFKKLAEGLRSWNLSRPLSLMLIGMASVSGRPTHLLRNLLKGSFSLSELRAGLLVHAADTGVLRNGYFDAIRFDAIRSMSSDGEYLTLQELACVIAADNARSPSRMGVMLSLVELGSLFHIFSTKVGSRQVLSIETMRQLYQESKVPDGWCPERRYSIRALVKTSGEILVRIPGLPLVLG